MGVYWGPDPDIGIGKDYPERAYGVQQPENPLKGAAPAACAPTHSASAIQKRLMLKRATLPGSGSRRTSQSGDDFAGVVEDSLRGSQVPSNESANDVYIRDVPLLARLSDDDLKALAARGRVRRFNAGVNIFHEGDPGDAAYVVVDGRIRMSRLSGSGAEATLAIITAGDCTGELALFDGRPRSATATAMQATRTFVVSRDDFVNWVRERPAASLALLETLSLRIRRTNEIVTDLVFLDLPQRLAKHLITLANAQGDGATSRRPRLQVTQAELASMLGVSRESVNKQLNLFARDGWITLSRGAVIIDDAGSLRTFV